MYSDKTKKEFDALENSTKEITLLIKNLEEKNFNSIIENDYTQMINNLKNINKGLAIKYSYYFDKIAIYFDKITINEELSDQDISNLQDHLGFLVRDITYYIKNNKPYGLDSLGELELYPTTNNPNPKHSSFIKESEEAAKGYANLKIGDTGYASSFIIGEDPDNLYLATNRHVIESESGKITDILFSKSSEIKTKQSLVDYILNMTLGRKKNTIYSSYVSKNIDLGIIKISKNHLDIMKPIHIASFSPNLIDNNKLILIIGNPRGLGTSMVFGEVSNNEKSTNNWKNKRHNAIEFRGTTYPGNSGGPIYSFNIIENEEDFEISSLYIVGILSQSEFQQFDEIEGDDQRIAEVKKEITEKLTPKEKSSWEDYQKKNNSTPLYVNLCESDKTNYFHINRTTYLLHKVDQYMLKVLF